MNRLTLSLLLVTLAACGKENGQSDPGGMPFGVPQVGGTPASTPAKTAEPAPAKVGADGIAQIVALEKRVTRALITADKATLEELLGPDFYEVSNWGPRDRATLFSELEKTAFEEGDDEMMNVKTHQPAPRVVILCYEMKGEVVEEDEQKKETVTKTFKTYCSSVWVNREGKWLNVFYQTSDEDMSVD